jgi:hypothetical protein
MMIVKTAEVLISFFEIVYRLHCLTLFFSVKIVYAIQAPVAQRIRASVFGTEGRGFESLRAYQFEVVRTRDLLIRGRGFVLS